MKYLLILTVCLAPLFGMAEGISFKTLQGPEREEHLREVSDFYNAFYRNPPYTKRKK